MIKAVQTVFQMPFSLHISLQIAFKGLVEYHIKSHTKIKINIYFSSLISGHVVSYQNSFQVDHAEFVFCEFDLPLPCHLHVPK